MPTVVKVQKRTQWLCVECETTFYSSRGLAIHKGRMHKPKILFDFYVDGITRNYYAVIYKEEDGDNDVEDYDPNKDTRMKCPHKHKTWDEARNCGHSKCEELNGL